jgi:hypothetical protein
VAGDGTPVARDDIRFRRMASLTALSLETNGGMCRDLLNVRYGGEPKMTGGPPTTPPVAVASARGAVAV